MVEHPGGVPEAGRRDRSNHLARSPHSKYYVEPMSEGCQLNSLGQRQSRARSAATSLAPRPGEWPLHKLAPVHTGERAADIPFGSVAEAVTGRAEAWVFVFHALNGAGFDSVGALGHQIGGEGLEELGP